MHKWLLLLLCATCFIACKPNYFLPGSEQVIPDHKRIAILPYETLYNGKIPSELSRDEWEELERQDALKFQEDLFDAIKDELRRSNKYLSVEIQDIKTTNHVLARYGMNIYEARLLSPEKLADTLRVDAVFIAQVERTRFYE